MPVILLVAALTVVTGKCREKKVIVVGNSSNPTREQRAIEDESNTHARRHQAVDMRVTVFLLGFFTIGGAVIKDGRHLVPPQLIAWIAIATGVGLIVSSISLFVSHRNVGRARTPQQIIDDTRRSDPLTAAATQLAAMEAISHRKTVSANLSLFLLIIDGLLFCAGLVS